MPPTGTKKVGSIKKEQGFPIMCGLASLFWVIEVRKVFSPYWHCLLTYLLTYILPSIHPSKPPLLSLIFPPKSKERKVFVRQVLDSSRIPHRDNPVVIIIIIIIIIPKKGERDRERLLMERSLSGHTTSTPSTTSL